MRVKIVNMFLMLSFKKLLSIQSKILGRACIRAQGNSRLWKIERVESTLDLTQSRKFTIQRFLYCLIKVKLEPYWLCHKVNLKPIKLSLGTLLRNPNNQRQRHNLPQLLSRNVICEDKRSPLRNFCKFKLTRIRTKLKKRHEIRYLKTKGQLF